MIREDGSEKTKQLFVGAMVLSLAVWLLYQFWFGKGLFEGKAFNNGPYGSGATEMVQLLLFLVAQVGALALGLFRTGADILRSIGSFLFGKTVDEKTNTSKLLINVNTPNSSVKTSNKVVLQEASPVFRTNESGVLFRDILLEKELSGPRTPDELAQDAVDALMTGDVDRLNQRVSQLYPEKVKPSVEVKVDESESE
jgi:hypothetical protein